MRRSIVHIFSMLCLLGSQNGSSGVVFDFVPFEDFDAGQENFAAAITVDEADVAAGTAAVADVDLLVTFTVVPTGIDPLDITLTAVDLNPAATNHTLTFSPDRQTISAFAENIPGTPSLADAWLLTQSFNPPGEPLIDVDHVAILRATEVSLESLITQAGGPDLLFTRSVVAGEWRRRVLIVNIDIKPGSDPNSINLGSAGVVPVAILSSPGFNATTVVPESVSLAGASVKLVGKAGKYLCHPEDANGDSLIDLVCKVYTAQFMIEEGQTKAVLEARTEDGTPIRGEDFVRIVPGN